MPANNSQAIGGAPLETNLSFAAAKLLFAMMSVTDLWESVTPSMSHHQTNNFRLASQNDPSGTLCHMGREVQDSVGTRLGRESIGPSDGCFGLQFLPLTNSSHHKHIAFLFWELSRTYCLL